MSAAAPVDPRAAALARAPLFACTDAATLALVAANASARRYEAGACIVAELESGADVFVVVSGEAEAFVDAGGGGRELLAKLGPGASFGEMSSLTGELRSATVTATTDVEVLVIADEDFDELRAHRPEVAVHLLRTLAKRLADAERSAEALLTSDDAPPRSVARQAVRRGSIRRVWSELVVNRQRDGAFLTLAAFVVTLLAARGAVFLAFALDVAPREVLRLAYLTGFALLMISSCASLLTFRAELRRLIAIAYGVGIALILNELGVTLAFDIFFKDIHTPDPNVPFDIERLYRRSEPLRFIAIGVVVLVQAAYLRSFYRRAWFIVKTRMRKLFARS
ncbi:MAG TPA: cyclic nucleotide-binding domain-containing protein [Byssovorax sp.]|jgi:CRP-like cAMP-binding protein